MKIYGYCRISTANQSIERQERNILERFPKAHIVKEVYTGTKVQGRKELDKILKIVKANDTIVFDSVSRMSRNADEGCELYEELFNKGINLVFLKESYIDTDVYKKAMENQIQIELSTGNKATDDFVNGILQVLNKYTIELAKEQIKKAFQQSEKEVQDLHQRTSEGLLTAKLNGKQIGNVKGVKLTTKKSVKAKEVIQKHNKDFNGSLSDEECWKLAGISRNSFYKYKAEIRAEM